MRRSRRWELPPNFKKSTKMLELDKWRADFLSLGTHRSWNVFELLIRLVLTSKLEAIPKVWSARALRKKETAQDTKRPVQIHLILGLTVLSQPLVSSMQ